MLPIKSLPTNQFSNMRFYLSTCFTLLALSAFAQNQLPGFLHPQRPADHRPVKARSGPEDCRPDSVLQFAFLFPPDSMLAVKNVWHYYGNDAVVRYTYNGDPLSSTNIDSTVFDASMRTVLEAGWGFDAGSNQLNYYYLTLYFPHGNTTQNDSVVSYLLGASGELEPGNKTLFFFAGNGLLNETQYFGWSDVDHSWSENAQKLYTYSPTGKVSKVTNNYWNGSNWSPWSEETYSYDANDSLILQLSSGVSSGIPISKMEYGYDAVEHSVWWTTYASWNDSLQSWMEQFSFLYDYDDQGRYEKIETSQLLIGASAFYRSEFIYLGNSDCPWYGNDYYSEDGLSWTFTNRSYYFPNAFTAIQEPGTADQWMAYPNPAVDYIWLEAPAGSPVRLVDLQGRTLYQGLTKGSERLSLQGVQGACMLWVGEGKAAAPRLIVVDRP